MSDDLPFRAAAVFAADISGLPLVVSARAPTSTG